MGTQEVQQQSTGAAQRTFMRNLLVDLQALEQMLRDGMIESGIRRIGAEQELFLVERNWRPAPRALDILKKLEGDNFTTELGLFNLEINLSPHEFGGGCLRAVEEEINEQVERVRSVCESRAALIIA